MPETNCQAVVDATELGRILGYSSETVRAWARRGKIPKLVLPNGRFMFEPEAVIGAMRDTGVAGSEGQK